MDGPQKAGDKYNYDVAAFLKTNVFEYSPGVLLDLRNYSFDAAPNPFPAIATSFNQKISMDLMISTSNNEYLCECKSSDSPRRMTINSKEFKESLLEFIGLEDYRVRQSRIVKYMLITSMPTRYLEEEIQDLKKDFDKVQNYALKLQKQGERKWSGAFKSEIDVQSIISALDNALLLQIEKGRLREAERDRRFREALIEIVQSVEKKNPKLVPTSLATRTHLRLVLDLGKEDYLEKRKLSYAVEISSRILDQILSYEETLRKNIVKATVKNLPFLKECQIHRIQEMTVDQVAKTTTETINDLIEERLKKLDYIAIFFPNLYEMYFAEINWASRIVDNHVSPSTRRYSLIRKNEAQISIPPYVSRLLITETRRLVNGVIVDPNLIDRTIEEDAL